MSITLPRVLLAFLALVALAVTGVGASGASFTSGSDSRTNQISAGDWVGPTVNLTGAGPVVRGSVALTATASDPISGLATVRIQRSLTGQANWVDICTRSASPSNCTLDTTQLPNSRYDLRAIATDNAGNSNTSTAISGVQVDNASPTVSLADPGTPLRGTIALQATAADAHSGINRVTVQYSTAGQGVWKDICTDSGSPYGCNWSTATLSDGLYDLRAIAVDVAGNSTTSSTIGSRRVDNSVNTITLNDPGEYLRGTVTLSANASSTSGVDSVAIQGRPAGSDQWITACTRESSPYSCSFDTRGAGDGTYDLRAVMTTNTGATFTSATVSGRIVDNTAPSGYDVQATNRSGGTAGRIETGDSVKLTWTELMSPTTLISGWSGTSSTTVYARVRDGAVYGTGGSSDWIEFWRNSGATQSTGLGAINLKRNFINANSTATFTSTATLSTTTVSGKSATAVTIVFGAVSGSGLQTATGNTTMEWTPSSSATDLAGNAASTNDVDELGSSDRDF